MYTGFHIQPETSFLLYHLAYMFWGYCVRKMVDTYSKCQKKMAATILLFATIAVCTPAIGALYKATISADRDLNRFAMPYLFGVVIFLLGTFILPIRFRAAAWIGEISYSIYLFHPVFFYSIYYTIVTLDLEWAKRLPLMAHIGICAVISLFMAALIYRWVERPGMVLADRLTRALGLIAGPASGHEHALLPAAQRI